MDKYYVITRNGKYIDVWDYSLTDNYFYARLYDSLEELYDDCKILFNQFDDLKIKELILDDEFNLICETFI